MNDVRDDACPFDWAEFNLPTDLRVPEDRSMCASGSDLEAPGFIAVDAPARCFGAGGD